jgi:TusA-related sulfurtransferase/uncharacterized protein (DUF2249 family)
METTTAPAWWAKVPAHAWVSLDVRPVLAGGEDPLRQIQAAVKQLTPHQGLQLTAPFVPAPLIQLLARQGFEAYSQRKTDEEVITWFWRNTETHKEPPPAPGTGTSWESIEKRFTPRLQRLDVRGLSMPQPMMQILAALEAMPADTALWVQHQRIPVYLLPELASRQVGYAIRETEDAGVELLLYKL